MGDDCIHIGQLGLHLLLPGLNDVDTHLTEPLDVPKHTFVPPHGAVHGRCDDHGDTRAQGGGGEGGHRRVVYGQGHLAYGVGGGRCDEEQVRPVVTLAHPANVLHVTGQAEDGRLPRGEPEGVWMDYAGRRVGHCGDHPGTMTGQLPGQVNALHSGDGAGDPEHDRAAPEPARPGPPDIVDRMHGRGMYDRGR